MGVSSSSLHFSQPIPTTPTQHHELDFWDFADFFNLSLAHAAMMVNLDHLMGGVEEAASRLPGTDTNVRLFFPMVAASFPLMLMFKP